MVDRARGALSTEHLGATSENLHPTGEWCEDDHEGVRRAAKERGHPEVTGCIDVGGYCATNDPMGNGVRRLCCATCTAALGPPAQSLPPKSVGPVDLYLLAGQSGCVGMSSVPQMRASLLVDSGLLVALQLGSSGSSLNGPAECWLLTHSRADPDPLRSPLGAVLPLSAHVIS